MKIQIKIIGAMVIWAHFVIAITWALAKFHDGLSVGFFFLWAVILLCSFIGLCLNWDETGRWWREREAKKTETQAPPKGEWQ